MKKTLATLLAIALVASFCGMLFVSAEETNIALGKTVLNAGDRGSYNANMTDGVALDSLTYNAADWFGYYWNPNATLESNQANNTNAIDGIAKPTVDLEKVASIDKVRVNVFDGDTSGISTPESITLKVSTDGETYTEIAAKTFERSTANVTMWVEFALETPVDARYVQLEIKMVTTFVFLNEIEVYEAAAVEPEAPSTGATNLVAGKEYTISEQFRMSNVTWGYDETFPPSYPDEGFELTDGLLPEPGYSEPGFMAFNQQTPAQAERGYAYVTFDLGAVCDLDELTYVTYKDLASGIQAPHTVEVYVSNDGENYELAGSKTYEGDEHANMTDLALATEKIALDVSAQYVQLRTISYGWCFLAEVEVFGSAAGGSEKPAVQTWEDTLVEGEDGNYTCGVPYGYTWNVNYVDGKIGGEDVTICTTDDAYKACNPNWAITVLLEKQADGTYVAVQDAVVTPGNADAITVGENQIALVAHSAYSNPNGTNWQGKVVAMSVKAGDVFEVADDMSTVYAVVPGGQAPSAGDAGILVFAVLAVVALAGVAVVSKVKTSL